MSTTTSTTTTAVRQLKIKAGECIVMPGNAKIQQVLASSNGVGVSSPDCPELADEIENKIVPVECFIIHIVMDDRASDSETSTWTANETVYGTDGISVNGVFYSFNTGIGDGGDLFMGSMANFINGHPVMSSLLLNATAAHGGSQRGGIATLCFKTLPSIAKDVYIQVTSGVAAFGSGNEPYANAKFYAVPYDSYNKAYKCSCSA
jgi:hypothetical protein